MKIRTERLLDPILHWSNIPLFQIRAKSLSSLSEASNEGA
jgi:hypothetical protein